jgi:hypothetical protein
MEKNVPILEDDAILSADVANIVRHALVVGPRVTASCNIAMEMMSENISFALLDVRVHDAHVRHALPGKWHRASVDQDQASMDKW